LASYPFYAYSPSQSSTVGNQAHDQTINQHFLNGLLGVKENSHHLQRRDAKACYVLLFVKALSKKQVEHLNKLSARNTVDRVRHMVCKIKELKTVTISNHLMVPREQRNDSYFFYNPWTCLHSNSLACIKQFIQLFKRINLEKNSMNFIIVKLLQQR